MKIHLPLDIQKRLIRSLAKAGAQEIGGVLMGEHLGEEEFRILDLTLQKSHGSLVFFVRMIEDAVAPLWHFFRRTGQNYRKFNYLGEWHSHPSFPPAPSQKDRLSMLEIVTDPAIGANFAVLLIVRLQTGEELDATATAFFPNSICVACELIKEESI